MTEVSFHFNATDRLEHACKVIRKAATSGTRVFVLGERPLLEELDLKLWVITSTSFISHHWVDQDPFNPGDATAVLGEQVQKLANRPVLLNLTDAVPESLQDFSRVIEIVSTAESDRATARQRWRNYLALGYPLERHDLAAPRE